jgi:hypothetical protein
LTGGLGVCAALFLAVPASALAADTYVDADSGSDTNPCTLALPCLTIQEGIDVATPGDTVHVDPDAYPLGLQIGDGKSLVAEEFVGGADGNASINGGGFTALDVLASGAGPVSGFSITSTTNPVIDIEGPIELRDNSILVPATGAKGVDVSAGPAGLVTIDDNEFFGDSTSSQTAINVRNGSEASITGNRVGSPGNAFNIGIVATEGATAEIAGNALRAFFQSGSVAGQPILVQDGSATITGNTVRNTQASPDAVYGILVLDTGVTPAADATLRRNQLYGGGGAEGIRIHDAPVTLDGDLVTGFEDGIVIRDVGFDTPPPRPTLDVTGVTAFGNDATDIKLEGWDLTLDSSIVGLPVFLSGPALQCTITHSRGPTTGGTGCTDFQTTAAPAFVDEFPIFGEPDLHLTSGSPMIDAGNPAAPAADALDMDGDPRALDGDGDCPEELRRDIGADEFGAPLDCDPPETKIKGKKRTTKERARFKLSSDEANSTFRCKLDKGRYRRCKARYKTKRLDPGKHKLKARAIDPSGNEDPTAAVKRFEVLAG